MRKKVVRILSIITLVCIAGGVYLFSNYNPMYDDVAYAEVSASIKEAGKYHELEPMAELYHKMRTMSGERYCPCADASYPAFVFRSYAVQRLYALKLRKTYTAIGCIKYRLTHADFNMGNTNVWQASSFYFHKKVNELNQSEQITLLLMIDNPGYYNRARHPQRIREAVAKMQKRLEE